MHLNPSEARLFPMYVVRVDSFLAMSEARPHQVLLREGLVQEFDAEQGAVAVFVSHQWCGRKHADPGFLQLSILQKVFRRAAAQELVVEHSLLSAAIYKAKLIVRPADLRDCMAWSMWYDYFSVPQPEVQQDEASRRAAMLDLTQAISSLHAYVEKSKYFLVLAPAVMHEEGYIVNYLSWKSRGWCRFERFAHVMTSPVRVNVLICKRDDRLIEMGSYDFFFDPVGRGDFSVQGDRDRLSQPAARLIARRLRSFLASGDMRGYIRLMSWAPRLMEGLSPQAPSMWDVAETQADQDPAECFLSMMHLKQPAERIEGTWPLLLATRMGNLDAMAYLLHRRADVACREARTDRMFRVLKGASAVHVAAERGHATALALLAEHRADLQARDAFGLTPLHLSGTGGSAACVEVGEFLLEHRADINARNKTNASPLELACIYDQPWAVKFLLSHGASVACNDEGQNPLHIATIHGARPEVVIMLLEAGASPCDRLNPRRGGKFWGLVMALTLSYRLGRRGLPSLSGYHCWGVTPLMTAAIGGDTESAALLLRARADPEARSARGLTARRLAEIFGASRDVPKDFACTFDRTAAALMDSDGFNP